MRAAPVIRVSINIVARSAAPATESPQSRSMRTSAPSMMRRRASACSRLFFEMDILLAFVAVAVAVCNESINPLLCYPTLDALVLLRCCVALRCVAVLRCVKVASGLLFIRNDER
jgi:hypothetical protein